jgi:nitrogen PTS system EIIA component
MGHFLNWISEKTIIQHTDYDNKEEVLKAIAKSAKKSSVLKNISENDLFSALKDRELLGTTGFGDGIAIPHCRIPDISDFVVGIITSQSGIDFEALDGEPVNLFIFIIAPEKETNQHIRLLSAISRVCQNKSAVNEIINSDKPSQIIDCFSKHLHDKIDKKENIQKFQFNVCTGNTELFQEVLQLFTSMGDASVYIQEARQPREYLSEMPLFMGFWGDTIENPWQVIIATVEKPFVNDTIRKIERITGNLNSREDLSVTVKELFYSSGTIKT